MKYNPPSCLKRCDGTDSDLTRPNRHIPIYREDQAEFLSDKALIDYFEFRKPLLTWLLRMGKKPAKAKGYSPYTVCVTAQRTARFDLWNWKNRGGYTIPPTFDDAAAYMEEVAHRDVKESTKGKTQEALKHYSRWLTAKHDKDPWEFKWNFQSGGGNVGPRDFLTKQERRKIRQAALHRGEAPEDDEPGTWKYTSLVWVSLDAGLRPVEVGNAKTSWCDPENNVLRIPREDSAKNENNWLVSLTDRTAKALEQWLSERADKEKYENTDALWLTREGNEYGSNQLSRLLQKLCDRAGIDHDDRSMSWYTIRHSVGTHMTDERDLAATKAQLRHENPKTTMKYDNVPVEDRQDALDNMG